VIKKTLLFLIVLAARPAAALDPRFVWETLDTPHFEIHYHQGMYRYAQRAARAAELSHRRLVPLLDHEPRERTQIVVQDDTDFANGNATPVLYNLIHAYAAPPDSRSTLADFDDNIYELISHEYTHILHLDTVLGLPQATNDIFGKLWITNGEQPLWFIEGIAVFAESEVSGAGRLRSSEEDMMVRAEVLEGAFPRIDQLSNLPLRWPRGFGQYTVGSRFLSFIRDQYGLGALRDLSHDFAGRAIPFGLNFSADRVLGETYLDLYKEFGEAEKERAARMRADVRAAGESRVEPLTRLGEWIRTPRWSPDGKTLYYASSGPDRLPEIRALDPGRCCDAIAAMPAAVRPGDHQISVLYSDGSGDDNLAVAPDGRVVYARKQYFQEFETLQDLYSVDPASGAHRRLTRGLRARGPDVAPDGSLAILWRRPGGNTAIAELPPGATVPRIIFEDPSGDPVDSPRWSPDGTRLAFLQHRDGSWDVRIVSRDGKALTEVTHDRALDRDPAWTPDGKWLLFSSDRTGIYNVYAWRKGELRQVTNVVFGAFEPQPSPDGTQLALVTYSSRGYDVGRIPLDEASWRKVAAPPIADDRPPPTTLPEDELFPARPYAAWPTLRPHFWLPYANADAVGTTLGVLTAGFDAVDRHEYAAAAWWSFSGTTPGWDVYYLNHSLYPDLSLQLQRDIGTATGAGPGRGYYYERFTGGTVGASFPFSQVERSQALSLRYELFGLSEYSNPYRVVTDSARLAAATLGYSYSDAFRFVRSISAEEGQRFSVSLRLSDPALGSSYSFWQLTTSLSRYFAMPWAVRGVPLHHAVALRTSFGISRGDLSNRHEYFLGGFQQGSTFTSVLNPANAPVRILRGFANDAFRGEAYALGTAEYRFPIWDLEAGAWTLPLYLRRLHAAVYTDVGDAFTPRFHDFKLHAGAGVELRAEVVLGWILPTDVRLGCARGLESSRYAILDCFAALGGVF
jgi:Tol biopolymer transport system component